MSELDSHYQTNLLGIVNSSIFLVWHV
ncbi:hypothetical protein F383_13456 [Gossypium arboreum]|uniref:Uncharacterized protein n=1 Tax=Gossypium arboreum TaxID=29729 RepID=A0A0B0N9S7_GOSAR|nr:hypothetical protein F383_13456 [Gossypium arboreum]